MADRFRDIEDSGEHRRKDAVLLATVSSFEALDAPAQHERTQFAALFVPLFKGASLEARRSASASLARCPQVPSQAAAAILRQPLDVAIPFITQAPKIEDALLIDAMRRGGVPVIAAVRRRNDLSPLVIRLADRLSTRIEDRKAVEPAIAPVPQGNEPPLAVETALSARHKREEALRSKLRELVLAPRAGAANQDTPETPQDSPQGVGAATPDADRPSGALEAALGAALAKSDTALFATRLAAALGVDFARGEAIMLDLSGHKLAEALIALDLRYTLITTALERFFPHLAREAEGERRSLRLIRSISYSASIEQLRTLRRSA